MRRFASIDLEICVHGGDPDTFAATLGGMEHPIPRGLYQLSFTTRAEDGNHVAELGYETATPERRHDTVRLKLTARNRRASAQFVMPAPAGDLSLRSTDDRVFAGTKSVRIRRLSSLGARVVKLTAMTGRLLSQPSRLPGRAWHALRIVRVGGISGLVRALDGKSDIALVEAEFARRYERWAAEEDNRLAAERQRLAAKAETLAVRPLLSIIMPVFDPSSDMLRQAIGSAKGQIWPHWELCIADDASTNPQIRQLIEEMAAGDARIRTVFRDENGHISEASNSALALASGEWLTFLDHDDRLAPHALLEVARAIDAHPDAEMIYSDEDKIDMAGGRCRPNFKPDWNPELVHAYNMVNHLACYRAEHVHAVGGFRKGYEGAQDYDLMLRVSERLDPSRIVHVYGILYHWRMHAQSAASSMDAKPYAMTAGERALNDHFERTGTRAKATLERTFYHTRYALPPEPPLVSIVIATRDRLALLERCITSITTRTDYPAFEIVVIDNGSEQKATLDWLKHMETAGKIRVLRQDGPFNYSALNNAGVTAARGEIVALLNNDIEILSPGWLEEMVSVCLQPRIGAVGARLVYPEGTIQHAGLVINEETVAGHWFAGYPTDYPGPNQRLKVRQAVSAVTGACLVTRKQTFLDLGGLDAENLAIAYNDVDYCLKVGQAGLYVVVTPFVDIVHLESASRGKDITPAKSARLYAEMAYMKDKWGALLSRDPMGMPGLPAELGEKWWEG